MSQGEQLVKNLKTKQIFFYQDTEKDIDQISREVYKDIDQVVHYPRGFEGGEKYKSIKKFIYKGFKDKLPIGVYKSPNYGWGFTKKLNPFAYFLDEIYQIDEVIIEKDGKVELDIKGKKIYLSQDSLELLHDRFDSIYKKHRQEINQVLQNTLYELFPSAVDKPKTNYVANALATSLSSWGNSIDEFSDEDKAAIKDLFEKLSINTDFISSDALAKTKEIIDNKYLQEALKAYKDLMSHVTDGKPLEKRWQGFLKSNSWIFSSIFAHPVILFKAEAYVGGKTLDNKNGKFNDFLIKNSLSNNVSFLEIKTHKTKLMDLFAYRGEDVYSASKELTGCLVQVLNQRDNFQKEFYQTKVKSKVEIETFNSKCVVLIGSISDLDGDQRYAFELFRSNSRDVEIITFDELQKKIEGLQSILLRN